MKKLHFLLILVLAAAFTFGFGTSLNTFNDYGYHYTVTVDGREIAIPMHVLDKIRTDIGGTDLPDWALMSPDKDGYEGTRTNELYDYIKTLGLEPKPIIVAVMDSGFEMDHPDLKANIWNNEAEINGVAGVDDDGNGFVDDFHGWNFLGKATNLNLEVTREYARLKKEGVSESDEYYMKVKEEYDKKKKEDNEDYDYVKLLANGSREAVAVLQMNNVTTDPKKLQEISGTLKGKVQEAAQKILGTYMLIGAGPKEIIEYEEMYKTKTEVLYDLTLDPSTIIGDNPNVLDEKNYGDNDPSVKISAHGTHVAGIIGSTKKGIGQAPFVKLMYIRVVPSDGDERDKDIANGIRYAADNGASIINLSAGKYFAGNADYVKEAIQYAESKGVLFVVAAGNEGTDIEKTVNYPVKFYKENEQMKFFDNLVCVGASTWMKQYSKDKDPMNLTRKYDLAAPFSNFSQNVVDVFAPGMEIFSTVPGGTYKRMSGTSMASPETAGVAAILKGYFPNLTAAQIKDILMKSSRKYNGMEVKTNELGRVDFAKLSKTGGVVDAYNAFKMAMEMK
ncbi:MAG: S8 family serine peptidase [Bacteroidetes bacterium]|nr:S8 family serine peptidase [Bacteroidota bacterium]